jgi:maleate cis-trans isomerase
LGPEDALRLAAVADCPGADTIFISCTNFHVLDAIAKMEARTGKKVVTSNQAGIWAGLRMLGLSNLIAGYGRLLSEMFDYAPVRLNEEVSVT